MGFNTCIYGNHVANILISDDKELWADKIANGGIVYVVVPGLQKCVIVTVNDFIFYKHKLKHNDSLYELEKEMKTQ